MKAYLSEYIHPEAREKLKSRFEIVDSLDRPDELDAAIVRTAAFPRAVMEKAGRLKVIGKHGIGYDNIDVDAARALGIRVVFTPTANVNSVAELIVGLALACKRRIAAADAMVRRNACATSAPATLTGSELAGTTVGLVGLGKIALTAGRMFRDGFHCRLIGYDPFVTEEQAKEADVEKYDDLHRMLAEADCVNVSVPLTPATRNLIGAAELDCLKRDAVLVNAARGGIVNEGDLYEALRAGRFFAAACDVFETEPPTTANPLTSLENFVATPHLGANTAEALYRMGMGVVEDVFRVIDGVEAMHPVC